MERLRLIDSHTGGEPTRVVVEGMPHLGDGSIVARVETLRRDFDRYRTAVIGEPRSSEVAVGAYLLTSREADFSVVFFNNVGYLGMCGHGTIGVVATLSHLGRIQPGPIRVETSAGIVSATLFEDGRAGFDNVPSYRHLKAVRVELPGYPAVTGDVAYGGNWFFITEDHGQRLEGSRTAALTAYSRKVMDALRAEGIAGTAGAEIDHVELVGPSATADSRNFVLCPGGEYDRSPCGTGTSARLACLFEDGKLAEGEVYRVESIVGSIFEGTVRKSEGGIVPTIVGRAFVNGETTLLIDAEDPFAWGIPRVRSEP